MPKYKVKSPLSHDGKDHKIGASVEMTEEQAKPLLGHTLALPGEDLTEKQVVQGAIALEGEAFRLAEVREQLTAEQLALQSDQEQLALGQAELETGRQQLAADRADFDKAAKAAAKK